MIDIGQIVLKGPKFFFYKTVVIFFATSELCFKNRTKELMKVISAIGCFPERGINSPALLSWNRDSLSIY